MFQVSDPITSPKINDVVSHAQSDGGKASERSAPFSHYMPTSAGATDLHGETNETLTGLERTDLNMLGNTNGESTELVDIMTLSPQPLVLPHQSEPISDTLQIVEDGHAISDYANVVPKDTLADPARFDQAENQIHTNQPNDTSLPIHTMSSIDGDAEATFIEDGPIYDKEPLTTIEGRPNTDSRTGNSFLQSGPIDASSIDIGEASDDLQTSTDIRSREASLLRRQTNLAAGVDPLATSGEKAITGDVTVPVNSVVSDTQTDLLPLAVSTSPGQSSLVPGSIGNAAAGSSTPVVRTISLNNPAELIGIVRDTPVGSSSEERIVLQLDPPELGRISIDFKFDGQSLQNVTIAGENPEAMRKLRLMHFELVQALGDRGLLSDSLTFNHSMLGDTPGGLFSQTKDLGEDNNPTEDGVEATPVYVISGPIAKQLLGPNTGLDIRV